MSGSLGPIILSLVSFTALLCALRLHLVADERVSRVVRITVWFSWVLSAFSLLLLPFDLARPPPPEGYAASPSCDNQPITGLSVVWDLLFWCSLALGFAMVELLRECALRPAHRRAPRAVDTDSPAAGTSSPVASTGSAASASHCGAKPSTTRSARWSARA